MQRNISTGQLRVHVERLRKIFDRRFEGNLFNLSPFNDRSSVIYITLAENYYTRTALSDRGTNEICGIVRSIDTKEVLCSFREVWEQVGASIFRFDGASITFFLKFELDDEKVTKQIFRLEWEDWRRWSAQNCAAHPHWQFDRWLTASEDYNIATIRQSLREETEGAVSFELIEEVSKPFRPDLRWFTRIHFPVIAPWATRRITDLVALEQPHRARLNSLKEVEAWTDSALNYIKNELDEYLV